MTWDAVLFDFEGSLADLSGAGGGPSRPYHDGRPGVPVVADAGGHPASAYLAGVQAAGLPLAVIGSSPVQAVLRWFEEQGLTRPAVVIGYHDTVLHRPSPDPLLEALRRLGVAPSERVVSLGDSADDVVAAARAGVTPATLRAEAPLAAPPTLFLDNPQALLEADLAYALAGSFDAERTAVTLDASLSGYGLRVGGRLSQPELARQLSEGAQGRWMAPMVDLAHTLVIHALGARPRGALLTWLPGFTEFEDPLAGLVRRLRSLTSLPTGRLLRPATGEDGEAGWELDQRRDLSEARVLVLCALRHRGEQLERAALVLQGAGAASVTGLVLAQEERPGCSPSASWGPTRLAADDLRRLRSRPRGNQAAVDPGAD